MIISRISDETGEPQTLGEIREWHHAVVVALVAHRATIQRAIRDETSVAPRFVGMTEDDLETYYQFQRRELNRLTALSFVASAEAAIRVDFFRRVKGKLKDRLSKSYRKWFKTLSKRKRRRPDFDEGGILHLLKDADVLRTGGKRLVGEFRECLRLRHWVAHGRYWAKPTQVDQLDPDDIFDRITASIQAIPT